MCCYISELLEHSPSDNDAALTVSGSKQQQAAASSSLAFMGHFMPSITHRQQVPLKDEVDSSEIKAGKNK